MLTKDTSASYAFYPGPDDGDMTALMIEYGDNEALCTKKMCLTDADMNVGFEGRKGDDGSLLLTLNIVRLSTGYSGLGSFDVTCPDPTYTIEVLSLESNCPESGNEVEDSTLAGPLAVLSTDGDCDSYDVQVGDPLQHWVAELKCTPPATS